jgi:succinate dehydrogenase / fumarate reductase membrane anchor subunit
MAKSSRIASARAAGEPGGKGAWTFIAQRSTALAILIVAPWFALAAALAAQQGYEGLRGFFVNPINAGATAVLVIAACWHMQIGMHEIIEDYIHKPGARGLLSFVNMAVATVFAIAGVLALAKMNFGV